MPLTPLPDAPTLDDTPEDFEIKGLAMVAAQVAMVPEINALEANVVAKEATATTAANTATTQATAAAASNVAAGANAAAAAASANAALWVTGTNYPVPSSVVAGARVYSPTDQQVYVDLVGGVSSTDPASDVSGRWISGMLPSAEAIGLPAMLPTAVFDFASGVIDRRLVESRSTDGTRYNIFGNLKTFAAGVAKPTFNPTTNACEGYLAEPAATYLAMRSAEMDNGSYWGQTNATVTPAAAIGIDGELSMYKVEAVLSGGSVFSRAVNATATAQYYAVRAKKGTSATKANRFAIYNNTTATTLAMLNINYDTGVVTQGIGTGATAVPVGHDGIWEIRIPCTSGIAIGNEIAFYGAFVGNGTDAAGDFSYVGFPDVADKPNLMHIPTEGGNVTTVGGGLTLDLTAHDDVINPAGFTLVCAFDGTYPATSGADEILFSVGSSSSNVIYLGLTAAGNFQPVCNVGGVTEIVSGIGPILAGRNRFAVSIQAGACIAVANGGAVVSMGTLSAVPSMTSLVVGTYPYLGIYQVSTPIELVAIYPRPSTAGELLAFVNTF